MIPIPHLINLDCGIQKPAYILYSVINQKNSMEISFLRGKKCVGLDIGSKTIKLVYLTFTAQKKFSLNNWKIIILPDEFFSLDTKSENLESIITNILKDLFSKNKNLPKNIASSVSGSSVIVRPIKVPLLTKEELSKSISIEAEPYIPFSIKEVYLSFEIIGEILEEGVRKNEVMVVAAKKDFVDKHINVLTQCGLVPKYIDVDIFAIERTLRYNYEIENENVCAVNIGANMTNVAIIENGVAKTCRDLPLGMFYILNEMKKLKQMEIEEIINYFKNDGLILTDEQKEEYLTNNKKVELSISKDLVALLKEFSTEFHKLVDFYYFQKGEQKPITKIFLSGGGCIIKNLTLYFTNEFKIETEIVDPFKKIGNADNIPAELRPIFTVAVGLAIKGYQNG
jgi:type IV pilus assembly protein PilM